jgi:hypothetical protein
MAQTGNQSSTATRRNGTDPRGEQGLPPGAPGKPGPRGENGLSGEQGEQARGDADSGTEQMSDSMLALLRRGQDTSRKSVQVWNDLTRQLTPAAGVPAAATMVSHAYDMVETLLAAQRRFVDDLIAAQRRAAQRFSTILAGDSDGDDPASR